MSTIKIWSLNTGLTKRTISIATASGVWSLQLLCNGVYLAAGLGNGNINIYNLNDGSLMATLQGHSNWVTDLVLINSYLMASSSHDNTLRIWDMSTNTNKFVLTGHTNSVRGLKCVTSDLLASGSFDATVKL